MSKRTDADLVEDIVEAITRIERYTAGLTLRAFLVDTKTQDATVRNLEIIGEAAKGLSSSFKKKHKVVPWQEIAGMRDRLIHDYAGVNWDIVWDVLQTKLPELRSHLEMLEEPRKQ
jgi:uncharacterized protein with HEPN domain